MKELRDTEALIERFVHVFLANPNTGLDDLINKLGSEGISNETAECLLAFVPMAFAHVLLGPMGVRLPARFEARDPDTNDHAAGVLKEEPIFSAALSAAGRTIALGEEARVRAVASHSAEWQVIQELTADGSKPSDCGLVEPILMRIPLSHFRRSRNGRGRRSLLSRLIGR